jgi:hypothetical protein
VTTGSGFFDFFQQLRIHWALAAKQKGPDRSSPFVSQFA